MHHRQFIKPKRRKRFFSTTTAPDDEEEVDHVSIYEDDATSIDSGTVRHSFKEYEGPDLANTELATSYKPRQLVGTAIQAALGGKLDLEYK